jgi:hypothetical protein
MYACIFAGMHACIYVCMYMHLTQIQMNICNVSSLLVLLMALHCSYPPLLGRTSGGAPEVPPNNISYHIIHTHTHSLSHSHNNNTLHVHMLMFLSPGVCLTPLSYKCRYWTTYSIIHKLVLNNTYVPTTLSFSLDVADTPLLQTHVRTTHRIQPCTPTHTQT